MKRSWEEDEYNETLVENGPAYAGFDIGGYGFDGSNGQNGKALEKRYRSGPPPMIVGPLIFNSQGTELQQALISAEPSDLPGVHRMVASDASQVRLWSPQWPQQQFMETNLPTVLQAVDGKCIFIFDTRQTEESAFLENIIPMNWLMESPTVCRFGVLVSKFAAPQMENVSHPYIPFIQDPLGSLAKLCKFHDYLGPSAVCVKNGEVVATTMLSRSPEILAVTLNEWFTF